MSDVLVVGAGLIGTSIGLALNAVELPSAPPRVQGTAPASAQPEQHWGDVCLTDIDPERVNAAVAAGAGRAWDGRESATLVILAVPPETVAQQLTELRRLDIGRTYTHVASVQSQVQREIEALGADVPSFVGSHPMAGRESSGPEAATADLFLGRRWAICPHPRSTAVAVAAVRSLVLACGSEPVLSDPTDHDAAVALTSHLPHVTSVALAALLQSPADLALSGPGLADMTRLAAGDPRLWLQVLAMNRQPLAPLVERLGTDLLGLAGTLRALESASADAPGRTGPGSSRRHEAEAGAEAEAAVAALAAFLAGGRAGRQRVPVKRGLQDEGFLSVAVTLKDEPGQLVEVLQRAAAAGVNVEDVRVEHLPGRSTGRALLWVRPDDEVALRQALGMGPADAAYPPPA